MLNVSLILLASAVSTFVVVKFVDLKWILRAALLMALALAASLIVLNLSAHGAGAQGMAYINAPLWPVGIFLVPVAWYGVYATVKKYRAVEADAMWSPKPIGWAVGTASVFCMALLVSTGDYVACDPAAGLPCAGPAVSLQG